MPSARSSGIFIAFDGPIDTANLPDVPGSLARDAKVLLLCVDPKSPDFLKITPAQVGFTATGSPYGADNLLTILPYQGFPIRARTAYAAVVLRSLNDASGQPLGVPVNLRRILLTQQPARPLSVQAFGVYREAVDALVQLGVSPSGVAALAAFTTADPTSDLINVRDDALKITRCRCPQTPSLSWRRTQIFASTNRRCRCPITSPALRRSAAQVAAGLSTPTARRSTSEANKQTSSSPFPAARSRLPAGWRSSPFARAEAARFPS